VQTRLTPKSKGGLAASDPVDQLKVASYVLHYGISARLSLRACVTDFAPLDCAASGDFT